MKQISILGCGWLGFPLALSLLKKGYLIKGSTTSPNKLSEFATVGIDPFLISLHFESLTGDIDGFLKNSNFLIISIPPKINSVESHHFIQKIELLIPFIKTHQIKKVLFISSTSVYNDSNEDVDESAALHPDTENGRQLLACEKLLLQNPNFETIVLRFGGLIGNDRHPIRFLAGRKNIANPEAPINLIHLDDCIGLLEKALESKSWNEIYNAVTPYHPTRKAYYTQKAIEFGLAIPEFDFEKPSRGKKVVSDKAMLLMDYTFVKNPL